MKADKIKVDTKSVTIIDVSGQQRYRRYWKMFYEEINGIVFVIDGTDSNRLKVVKEEIEKLDKDLEKKLPVVFLINKQDVEGALNKGDIKNFIDIDKLDSNFIWTMK